MKKKLNQTVIINKLAFYQLIDVINITLVVSFFLLNFIIQIWNW